MKNFLIYFWRKRRFIFAILSPFLLFFGLWAFWYEPSSLVVKNYDLKIKHWNPAHNNLKIAAISDVHGGSNFITEEKIRKVVELTNEQTPDLIVLLGDFVSEQTFNRAELNMPASTIAVNLSGFKAKYGVFAVLGNHDFRYNLPKVRTELERVGIRVLDGETAIINHNNQDLIILGLAEVLKINEWYSYANGAKNALKTNRADVNVLALVHNPDAIGIITGDFLVSENLRLVLAGHTHGGQVRLPLIGSIIVPSSYGQRYALGHVVENGIDMFVTTGIGTSILPVRFGVPPEISVLTISAKQE
ncbi:MAG TPA: metallophosphoesterase [Pyrinomonadaceae bacterium]